MEQGFYFPCAIGYSVLSGRGIVEFNEPENDMRKGARMMDCCCRSGGEPPRKKLATFRRPHLVVTPQSRKNRKQKLMCLNYPVCYGMARLLEIAINIINKGLKNHE